MSETSVMATDLRLIVGSRSIPHENHGENKQFQSGDQFCA